MALPSQNKNFATFQQEDASCRQTASQVIGVPPPAPGTAPPPPVPVEVAADMQQRFDVAYTQCMYGKGNQVTAPPQVYAGYGYPYDVGYAPYYYGGVFGYGPYLGFGFGYGGRDYYGGGYRGGFHGGEGLHGGGGGGFHR
jgi:uncharacterized membrane protein YgcG